jgi:hypothetical protein
LPGDLLPFPAWGAGNVFFFFSPCLLTFILLCSIPFLINFTIPFFLRSFSQSFQLVLCFFYMFSYLATLFL